MMVFYKSVIACCFWLIITLQTIANNNLLQTYVGLSYHNQIKRGYASAFAFHDHDPRFGNSNFHVHNYCNPFVDGREVLQAITLKGQYALNEKIALAVNLPYSLKTQVFADSLNLFRQGFGDVALGFKYALYKSKNEQLFSKVNHQTIFSIYAQFKTGKYNEATELGDIDPHIQNGAGTTNWQASLQHVIIFDNWQLNSEINYQLNTKNYYQFRKGNTYEAFIEGVYNFDLKESMIFSPIINVFYQKKIVDTMEERMILKPTGYETFAIGAGFGLLYEKMIFRFNCSIPVYLNYEVLDVQCKAPESQNNIKVEMGWLFY